MQTNDAVYSESILRLQSLIRVSVYTTHVSLCVDLLWQFVSMFRVCSIVLNVSNDAGNSNVELAMNFSNNRI
jgi:hypothetical protein